MREAFAALLNHTNRHNYIHDQSGRHFDPQVVDAFLSSLNLS